MMAGKALHMALVVVMIAGLAAASRELAQVSDALVLDRPAEAADEYQAVANPHPVVAKLNKKGDSCLASGDGADALTNQQSAGCVPGLHTFTLLFAL